MLRQKLEITFVVIVSSLALVSACSFAPLSQNQQTTTMCLPSRIGAAFPVASTEGQPNDSAEDPVPNNWLLQLTAGQANLTSLNAKSLVVSSPDDLWLTGVAGGLQPYLLRYKPSTQSVVTYSVKTTDGSTYVPVQLFQSRGGDLWGVGATSVIYSSGASINAPRQWLLSAYDPSQDRFVAIEDSSGILTYVYSGISVAEGQSGTLWFLTDDGLLAYTPSTQSARRVETPDASIRWVDLTSSSDGKLWLLGQRSDGAWEIVRYDETSDSILRMGSPPNTDVRHNPKLFVERSGRIWVDNTAWLEWSEQTGARWYEIVRPSIFVAGYASAEATDRIVYSWDTLSYYFESSDGLIWLSGASGLTTFDPETQKWCLIHKKVVLVGEDDEKSIWIVTGTDLYKYSGNTSP